jgi:hypothetical protein
MDTFRYQFSFIVRYRALWQKFLGIAILRAFPDKYETFMKQTSKKKAFIKIVRDTLGDNEASSRLLQEIMDHLKDFDEDFRTTEIHGTGRIRKWIFTSQTLEPISKLK